MEFQLSQARLRAVVGTLAAISGVAIPFFGYLGIRYVENMDAASIAVGRLTTEIAVMNTQMTYLREDIGELQGTVKILQDRAHKALYMMEGANAKTQLPEGARISTKSYFGQAWAASAGVYGFSYPANGGFFAWQFEEGGA